MFCMLKKKRYIYYVSEHNSNRNKQVIFSMVPNREGWHYLPVKKLPALLSVNTADFYCLNCLHCFPTKNKSKSHRKVCESKKFGNILMPSEDTKILQFNQSQKPDKAPSII